MKILNIHGFRGVPDNGVYHALKRLADPIGAEIVSPTIDYDRDGAPACAARFRALVETERPDLVAGMSLGGFFAGLLCAEYHLPTILVNACLLPFVHLPRLDYAGDVRAYMSLFPALSGIRPADAFVLIGGKDEIVDTHDFTRHLLQGARFYEFPEGKHESTTLGLDVAFEDVFRRLRFFS